MLEFIISSKCISPFGALNHTYPELSVAISTLVMDKIGEKKFEVPKRVSKIKNIYTSISEPCGPRNASPPTSISGYFVSDGRMDGRTHRFMYIDL